MEKDVKKKIEKVLKENGIKKAGIFGSYARGSFNKKSDIDILIKPDKNMNLLDFIHLKNELENSTGKKIDLVTYKGIHPLIKKSVLKEEVVIL